jgi:hypothetical protein|tara:strand:- start:554 stop:1039 length:486 start_codon:yes stop_codon:yes gene_type:complete
MEAEVQSVITRYISQYQKTLMVEYPSVNAETLDRLWQGVIRKEVRPTDAKKKKPKTAYQHFFAMRREELSTTNAQLSFGELSKQVSQQWKTMSVEEKNKYGTPAVIPLDVEKPVTFDNILQFAEDEYVDNRTTFETHESDNDDVNIDEDDEFLFEGDEEDC